MAADCVVDGDYLGEYSRFFAEFVARVNPNDQLPVKVSVYDVSESELVGEIISVTLQYLNRIYCPPSLQSYIARLVIQAIKSTCKKQPEICGLRQQDKTYAPLKLMQAITNEVNEICRRYLDNSRLALLPPPSSTPQVTVGAIRNSRRKMEDRHMILHDLNTMFNIQDDTIVDYYAVFDGHGGQDAAAYCATHLHQYLVESTYYPTDPESALRDAFLATDSQFIAKSSTQKLNGGTTAVCALLINKKLYIAWVGDSMASLVTGGNVKQLVNPHRPTREDESERIRNMGGVVVHCMGVLRVNGFLSISRAIGDVSYKPYISGEPEVRCVSLDGTEDFLIIACDGLWDYVDQRTAALRVYRQVLQNPYDLKHVHQALLQSAKRAGSLDNITVIVVFLKSPIEIASRSNPLLAHQAPNGLLLNNMDPNNPIPSNHEQFDVKSAYIKQLINEDMDHSGFDINTLLKNSAEIPCGVARNGKHREDDDDEYDYTDIGPETDVDAGEDVHDNNYPLAASSSLDPSPESEKLPVESEKHIDDDRNDNNYSNRDNANVCPAVDSSVDDGDVDNHVRPSDKDVCGADDELLRDNDDGDARVETTGTHAVMDDDESPPSPQAAKPLQHALIEADNVADSEDSEDEWNYFRVNPNKQEPAVAVAADESHKDVEEQSAQENPESVAKDSSEIESLKAEKDNKCVESDIFLPELIDTHISDERKSNDLKKDWILLSQEAKKEQENMDFQLNPEAAEFVPLSPSSLGNRDYLKDFALSGSPLKQPQVMDDIPIPSQREFDMEVSNRPMEIGEEFSKNLHDEHADLQNNSSQNLDVSEISSTKAEMGDDESMMHVMTTSQWQTNISSQWNEKTVTEADDIDSDIEESIIKNDPMIMSFTPGNLKAAFEESVDLNAVHMLDDSSDGAEQVSTPPRSPEPYTNENRAHTPLSEDKNPIDVLCASTPQPPDEVSVSTLSSEMSFETKASSLSAPMDENEKYFEMYLPHPESNFNALAKKVIHCMPGIDIEGFYPSSEESQVKDDSLVQLEESTEKVCEEIEKLAEKKEEEEEKEKLCKIQDEIDTSCDIKATTQSSQNCLQTMEKESRVSEMPKNLPDSTNSISDDAIHGSEQCIVQQSLLENVYPETASGTEKTHCHTDFDSEIIPETESQSKIESNQINQSNRMNLYETANFIPQLLKADCPRFNEDGSHFEKNEQEEIGKFDSVQQSGISALPSPYTVTTQMPIEPNLMIVDELLTNETEQDKDDDNVKPDSTIELNPSDSVQQSGISIPPNLCTFTTQIPIVPNLMIVDELLTNQTEQEQSEKKDAPEFASIKKDEKEVASEDIFSKEGKTEPQGEPIKVSAEDTATTNESKEEVTQGITDASVGAVVGAATVAAVAMASPIKAKPTTITTTTTTTGAKRSTKTMTTKASTAASTTKSTVAKSAPTKSTPTSPSKATSAAMRATTTSSAQSVAKKPATSTAARPKQLDGSAKAAISSASGKTTVTKSTITAKAAISTTTTATRTSVSPRVNSGTTRPPKTTTTTSSRTNSGMSSEKKSPMSGDAKSVSKSSTMKPTGATSRTTTTTGATAKTTLVKTASMTARTAASGVTLKPRPTSATSAAKSTSLSKQPAITGVNGASRPRTAPISGGTTKPRESTGKTITTAKSPLIDKQSKETVNKQISRSGGSASKSSGRASATPVGSPTVTSVGATKTRALFGKSSAAASATLPTKKPLTSKTASRTSAATRSSSEAKILQNGIAKEDMTKAAVITAPSKTEDDVPEKDASPVNVSTDNQLIAD